VRVFNGGSYVVGLCPECFAAKIREAIGYARDKKPGGVEAEKLQKAVYLYFKRYARGTSEENLWSCFKAEKDLLKGDEGYTKGFLAVDSPEPPTSTATRRTWPI
jgi:hypothetical protein